MKRWISQLGFSLKRVIPYLRRAATVLREHAQELALLDSLNNGNPVSALSMDAGFAADYLEYFAGLATEIKGETIPMGDGNFNYTIQEPLGVVARIGREECFTELLEFTYTKNVNLKIG